MSEGDARRGRVIALVIAGAMVVRIVGQWLLKATGRDDPSYAIALDLLALAALGWALFATFRLWQRRKDTGK